MAKPSAQLCTPEEQEISARTNAPLHCLTRNESIALSFVVQAGLISLFACLVAYALIFRNVCYHARRMPDLIKVPMEIYLLSLFAADMVLALAGVINAKWVNDGKSQIGGWCSAQAIGLMIGTATVASNALAIAVHTFVMLWWRKGRHATSVARIAVIASWLYSILYAAAVGSLHRREPNSIFRPAPTWCWIGENYLIHRLFGGYIWVWTAVFTSLLSYIPLFFLARGNITVGNGLWDFRIHRRENNEDVDCLRHRLLSMIAYPLIYSFIVLPLSITRWIGFVQEDHGSRINHVPTEALIAVQTIHCLNGMCDVLLFLLTRPRLPLFKTSVSEITHNGNLETLSADGNATRGNGESHELGEVERHPGEWWLQSGSCPE